MNSATPRSVRLCELPTNTTGLLDLAELDADDRRVATAIGLGSRAPVRLARGGRNCIVEVHQTRVGVGRFLAERLRVHPLS